MTRAEKVYRWLGWFLTLCGSAVIAYMFCGCAHPPILTPAEVATLAASAECDKAIDKEIAAHEECPAAQLAINGHRACQIAYPKGLSLDCPEFRR